MTKPKPAKKSKMPRDTSSAPTGEQTASAVETAPPEPETLEKTIESMGAIEEELQTAPMGGRFSVGSMLAKRRQERSLTIQQVAKELNIRGEFLCALEKEKFHEIPGPAYVKGFARTYALYLELDSDDLVKKLEHAGELPPSITRSLPEPWHMGKSLTQHWVLLAVGMMLLVVMGITAWVFKSTSGYPIEGSEISVSPEEMLNDLKTLSQQAPPENLKSGI